MKRFLRRLVLIVLALGLPLLLYKGAQKLCWDHNVSAFRPPSLDSWDPTERVEAARQAAKKYGGLK